MRQGKKEKVVPSLLLWEGLGENDEAPRLRRRLKPDVLFFLQLLILILLLFALLQPVIPATLRQPDRLVLVIDCSASMLSTDLSPNRFQQAIKAGLNILQENSSREIALVAAQAVPEVLSAFTRDQQALRNCLRALTPKPEGVDPKQALELASSLLGPQNKGEIILVTDGAFPALDYPGAHPLRIIQAGQPAANLAINGLEARATGRPGEYQVLVRINNFSPQTQTTRLNIADPEATILRTALTFQPWEEKVLTYNLTTGAKTTWRFLLESNDSLAIDNQVTLPVGREPRQVLLVGPGNFFLERCLRALPDAVLTTKTQITPVVIAPYDLIIFDRILPPPGVNGNIVLINTYFPEWERPVSKHSYSAPGRIWGETAHPILRFVELGNWSLSKQLSFNLDNHDFISLASSPAGPILLTVEEPGRRTVLFCFDLFASNLPLQVSFPVLLANLLSWLAPEPSGGEPVNLLPAAESDLTPRYFTSSPATHQQNKIMTVPEGLELWPVCVLLILLLLMSEWGLYHRPSISAAKEAKK